MAVTINIPSQVKTYANLAAFPASGNLKTIYIAEDTNKTYRWTGSVYVEISGADFSGYVPTSRTLTINGTTQDLSANRTFTISTGLTVGTTPIASGTIGRVLFEGTGNVLQQSANLFWDNTNGRLGIGSATPLTALSVNSLRPTISIRDTTGSTNSSYFGSFDDFLQLAVNRNPSTGVFTNTGKASAQISIEGSTSSGKIFFYATNTNGATPLEAMRINGTGNVLIGTTTDAGFRLDVNGTARVVGPTLAVGDWTQRSTSVYVRALAGGSENRGFYIGSGASNDGNVGSMTWSATTGLLMFRSPYNSGTIALSLEGNTNSIQFHNQSGTAISKFFSNTGNWGLGTTTDAGFRLDVNGTAIVRGVHEIQNNSGLRLRATGGGASTSFRSSGNSAEIRTNDASIACMFFNQNGVVGFSQPVAFGNTVVSSASALVQIDSTTKGFLPPRMTTTERNAIASPAAGLIVYDTTLNLPHFFNGTIWVSL
jgi:hypothetical protein